MRTVKQFQVVAEGDGSSSLYVLFDDGTLHERDGETQEWTELELPEAPKAEGDAAP